MVSEVKKSQEAGSEFRLQRSSGQFAEAFVMSESVVGELPSNTVFS
jgi:hypothetical protein